MTPEPLDLKHLIARLRYQARQYTNGQIARGGTPHGKHMLDEAADLIERQAAEIVALCKRRPHD